MIRRLLSVLPLMAVMFIALGCSNTGTNEAATSMLHPNDVKLVNVKDVAPGVLIEANYATPGNFVGITFYPANELYIVPEVGQRLSQANQYLQETHGFKLKLWDAYRPLQVQKKMWEIMPDPRYVADPAKGSRHNRGCAVDVTLVTLNGDDVAMPTGYDDFSEKAHLDYADLPVEVLTNRAILIEAMIRHGFEPLSTEWWHFDAKGWERYPVLDRNPYGQPLFPDV